MNVDTPPPQPHEVAAPPQLGQTATADVGQQASAPPPGYHHFLAADGTYFVIPVRYQLDRLLGKGAYGVVCSATDLQTGQRVAIKKVINCFHDLSRAQRVVRELSIMATLRYHPKICSLLDILIPPRAADGTYSDVYFAMELLDTDIHHLFVSERGQPPPVVSMQIVQYITKQLVQGVSSMHKLGILHRDLTPKNVLATEDVKVRVADFGLAREIDDRMTEYVVTRWYRPPEIMFGYQATRDPTTQRPSNQSSVDMWSVGCIVAEMLGQGKVLLKTDNYIAQVQATFALIGTPTEDELKRADAPTEVMNWVRTLKPCKSQLDNLAARLPPPPDASEEDLRMHKDGIDFVKQCLVFDPTRRITAADALKHAYIDDGYESEDEPYTELADPPRPLPVGHPLPTISDCRTAIDTICEFLKTHPSVRQGAGVGTMAE